MHPAIRRHPYLVAVVALLISLIIAALASPNLITTRMARNQWNTSYGMEHIAERQRHTISDPKSSGYLCDLGALRDRYSEDGKYGYLFTISCGVGDNGRVLRYQVTAIPQKLGTTGKYAFCLNEEGIVWYSKDGLATSCMNSRKPYRVGK